jgi:hypothetical protein
MATRRNFFKYLGLAGGVATGGVVAAAAVLPDPDKCKAVNEIETNRSNLGCLSLQQGYGEKKDEIRFSASDDGPMTIGIAAPKTPLKVTNVSMTPGPDGEMYLNINGKWRRIVTE